MPLPIRLVAIARPPGTPMMSETASAAKMRSRLASVCSASVESTKPLTATLAIDFATTSGDGRKTGETAP
jgi:hypothetical protein